MKVYKFTTENTYSGGCIIIAANNEDEAINILKEEEYFYNWFKTPVELTTLTANVDAPQVLINETYFE